MQENNIDSILLDLDGTLVDTASEMHLALNVLLNEEVMELQPYEAVRPHVSNGVMGIFKTVFKDSPKANGRRFNRYLDIYEEHLGVNAQIFPGMNEVINLIEYKSIPWGIVTNKSKRFTMPLLKKLKFFDRASCIVCGDTTTEKKPHPEPINHALSLLNIQNTRRSFYLGDSKKDIDAAKSAGISSVACTFGYIKEDDDPKEWYADYLIDQPSEMLEILNNLI